MISSSASSQFLQTYHEVKKELQASPNEKRLKEGNAVNTGAFKGYNMKSNSFKGDNVSAKDCNSNGVEGSTRSVSTAQVDMVFKACGSITVVEEIDEDVSSDSEDEIEWKDTFLQKRSSINPNLLSASHINMLVQKHRRSSFCPEEFSRLRETCNQVQQRRLSLVPLPELRKEEIRKSDITVKNEEKFNSEHISEDTKKLLLRSSRLSKAMKEKKKTKNAGTKNIY